MNPLLPYNAFITHMAAQPTLPSFYWQVYSYEQRIKEICIRLQRCILYNDYTVENVNELIDLVNNLSTRVDELNDQIQDVNKRLLEEIERATAAEEEITNNLNAEIERAKAAEAELSTRIDKVSADLATETERAKQAEAALDAKIEAETERATAKENELEAAITAETERAEQVEAKLSSDITAESQRAYQAEQQIKSDLTAEINRATTREDEIEAKIDDATSVNSLTPTTVTTVPTAGTNGYAWGEQAKTRQDGVSIGFSADSGQDSVAIGSNSYAGDNYDNSSMAVAVGATSHADNGGTAAGHYSNAGKYSVAIGEGAEATVAGTGRGRGAVAIGSGSIASQDMTVSVGNSTLRRRIIRVDTPTQNDDAATKEYVDTKIADIPSGTTINSIAPLTVTTAPSGTGTNAIAIGNNANAVYADSIAIGSDSVTYASNTVSFGSSLNRRRIENVKDPEKPQDAATKNYVDNAVGSVSGGMEFPDYSTFKTLSITSPVAGTSAVTPDVDGYLLLWGTVGISESNRSVTMSVPNGPTWAPILSFPVARTTQDEPDTGPIGSPIPIKAGTTVRITPSDSTITLLSVRHFYKASE